MQGFVFYEGPSLIDSKPVVGIVTGLKSKSANVKTGAMAQVYFLRSNLSPLEAARLGEDQSICGTCRHRGRIEQTTAGVSKNVERSCYVTLFQGPSVVYRSYAKGSYPVVTIDKARSLLKGKDVRLGAYGDPGCIPASVLTELVSDTSSHTGYTHLWSVYPELRSLCMASCDTPDERERAKALGFRTFRVRTKDEELLKGEGHCPASAEMGKSTTCKSCLLCDGMRRSLKVDVSLLSHGSGSGHFEKSRAA